MKNKGILYAIAFLLAVNIALAAYLAYEFYYPNENSICSINAIFDCVSVARSGYAVLFGVPVAIWGVIFYGGLFVLTIGLLFNFPFHKINKKLKVPTILAVIRLFAYFGVAFSLGLTYIEAFVINVYCPFCVAQQIIIIVIAGLLMIAKRTMRRA